MSKKKLRIGVFDYETDPFSYGEMVLPFVAGFLTDDGEYREFWGEDGECVEKLVSHWKTLDPGMLIYAHNGGKFDFLFMLEHVENPIRMIRSRLVECRCAGHVLRDSYAILPVPLGGYAKEDIDYDKMRVGERDIHKDEILKYLRKDCDYLMDLVMGFVKKFTGPKNPIPPLTVGSAALRELRRYHPQKLDSTQAHDENFRRFYYGGRVQCFESGIIEGDFKIYDVNSMYPAVMRDYRHPIGTKYVSPHRVSIEPDGSIKGFERSIFFIVFEGSTKGHVPFRNDKGGIDFTPQSGTFYLISHEFKAAYSRGFIKIDRILSVQVTTQTQSFVEFVDKYGAEKVAAKLGGDKVAEILAKLMLNSAAGKFSQDPRAFRDWVIQVLGRDDEPGDEYQCELSSPDYRLWKKKPDELKFNDVAIAASITSAARAVLLDGIYKARRVLYCDTDSIICESPGDIWQDKAKLGAWKYEGSGSTVAIAGKKLYCVLDSEGNEVKKASKGAKLTTDEIMAIAGGQTIVWDNPAPSMSAIRETQFVSRKIRSTLKL